MARRLQARLEAIRHALNNNEYTVVEAHIRRGPDILNSKAWKAPKLDPELARKFEASDTIIVYS